MDWKRLSQTWHYVEKWAADRPNEEAVIFGDERVTWRAFKSRMDEIAASFLEIGVDKGDRIAFLAMARTEFPTTFMAAGKIGAVWLGLNPKFSLDELRYQIGDSRPKVLIGVRQFLGNDLAGSIGTLAREFPFIRKILVIGDPVDGTEAFAAFTGRKRDAMRPLLNQRASAVEDDDETLLMYTSGSTGKPKGVVHTHRSIVENIKIEAQKFHMPAGFRVLLHFPVNHVAADVEIGFGSILVGGCLVCMDRFDPAETLKMIEKERINFVGQLPVMYLLEMQLPAFKEVDWSHVQVFAWAGAKAPDIMVRALAGICAKTGGKLITGYGSTEVCGFVTYTEINDTLETLVQTAGKIASPLELKIFGDDGKELPDGETGEIVVRGPVLFKKYLNQPEETARVIDRDGWYHTNDMASKDERGYITITGRKSEMFKTGGENVFPREIEDVLETHPAVLFAAVIGVPDPLYAEVGWAFVMQKAEVSEDDLKAFCRSRLANFKIPKQFFIRPLLPLLANGKVDKMALKREVQGMLK